GPTVAIRIVKADDSGDAGFQASTITGSTALGVSNGGNYNFYMTHGGAGGYFALASARFLQWDSTAEASAATPDIRLDRQAAGALRISLNSGLNERARFSDGTDQQTCFMISVNRTGTFTLERVTMGATDSGGTGFKLLRVPN